MSCSCLSGPAEGAELAAPPTIAFTSAINPHGCMFLQHQSLTGIQMPMVLKCSLHSTLHAAPLPLMQPPLHLACSACQNVYKCVCCCKRQGQQCTACPFCLAERHLQLAVELLSAGTWSVDMSLYKFITEVVMEHEWTCSILEVRDVIFAHDTNFEACAGTST